VHCRVLDPVIFFESQRIYDMARCSMKEEFLKAINEIPFASLILKRRRRPDNTFDRSYSIPCYKRQQIY